MFIPVLENAILRDRQAENVRKLLAASSVFYRDAGMHFPEAASVNPATAVLESGHQPNFLPYPGIFKKVFSLQALATAAENRNIPAIGFFGFADQNLSTAPLLHSNRVPSVTRDGFEKIGFKISETDRWNRFCCVEKPPRDIWDAKMGRLKDFYIRSIQSTPGMREEVPRRADQIFDLFDESYRRAKNFADLNAFLFAAICRQFLGLGQVFFFRYSDVQKGQIFVEEAKRIVLQRKQYIEIHNRVAMNNPAIGISPLSSDHIPFWYHCTCGRKLELTEGNPSVWRASCNACGMEYSFDMDPGAAAIEPIYERLGFSAISRNLIFSEGLGVAIFVSGTGGSLRYGTLSGGIGREIGFHTPATLAWGGRDYYLGPQQVNALMALKQVFSLKDVDFMDTGLEHTIVSHLKGLSNDLLDLGPDPGNKETRKKLAGKLAQARTQIGITTRLFSINPSILDLLVSVDQDALRSVWQETMEKGSFSDDAGVIRLQKDCVYPHQGGILSAVIPGIQKSLINVEACQ